MSDDWKATIIGITVWISIIVGSAVYGFHCWCVLGAGAAYEKRCSVEMVKEKLEQAISILDNSGNTYDEKQEAIESALDSIYEAHSILDYNFPERDEEGEREENERKLDDNYYPAG